MLVYYEYPKCSTCRKAKAELKALGLSFETVDIKQEPPKAQELKTWMVETGFDLKKYFNTSGISYRQLGLKDRLPNLTEAEALDLLASDGMLIKRPLLVQDNKMLQIGYKTPYKDLNF